MSTTQTQIRRDTATNLLAATPALSELGYDTTNKRIVVGDGATAGGIKIPSYSDVQKHTFTTATTTGSANAYVAALSPPTLGDTAGQELTLIPNFTNTASATVAIDGRSACTLKKIKNGALSNLDAGDVISGVAFNALSLGSSNYLVTSLGQQTSTATGLVPLGTVNASGAAQVSFGSSLINGTYNKYQLEFDSLSFASGDSLIMEYSTNNGSSWITSGYLGRSNAFLYGTGVITTNSTLPDPPLLNVDNSSLAITATDCVQGTIKFAKPNVAQRQSFVWELAGEFFNTTVHALCQGMATYTGASTTYNAVRLLGAAGANMNGNFHLYGITGT